MLHIYYISHNRNLILFDKFVRDVDVYYTSLVVCDGDWDAQKEYMIAAANEPKDKYIVVSSSLGVDQARLLIHQKLIAPENLKVHWIAADGEIKGPLSFDKNGRCADWQDYPNYWDNILDQLLTPTD